MKWFSRRPFTALLVSMALVAFLPLLLNNLFYIRFRNTVLEQQKSLTEESLKFSVQQIDRTLMELTTLSLKLGEDLKNTDIPPIDKMDAPSRMELNGVSKLLSKEVEAGSEYIDSLYLYSAKSRRAVGNTGVYDEGMTYQKFYCRLNVPPETMQQLHQTFSYGHLVSLDNGCMAFIRTVSRGTDGLPEKQLVILLKRSFYNLLIDKANVEGGIFILSDNEGNILAVSNKTGIGLTEDILAVISAESESEDFDLMGETSILYTLTSDTVGYQVKAVIPYSQLLDTSLELQRYYWLLLAASVVLGLALSVFLSRRNVMPLNRIISYIQKNYGSNSSATQGLEQIKSAVDELLDQRRTAQEQLQQYETVISRNSLRETLRGNSPEAEAFRLPTDCRYAVVCFSAGQTSVETEGDWILASQQALPEGCFCRSVILDGGVTEILGMVSPDFGEREVEELLTAQIDWLDQQCPLTVSASFSSVYQDPQELERAYGEACMAMTFAYTRTDAVITSFSSCEFKTAFFLRDWHHLDKQLLFSSLIGEKRFDEAAKLLPSLFPPEFLDEYFPESDISSLHLASLKYQFLHDLDNLGSAANMDDESWNRLLHELIYCKTHKKLCRLMEALFSELAAGAEKIPSPDDSDDGRVGEIKQYICRTFADQMLSVSSVASVFGMSANSLSQLFSRKADCGVLDYIHEVRMKKAGELLISCKNLTIQEIAAQVGYTSILTFNRKFKACYNQTPSEFRRSRCPADK